MITVRENTLASVYPIDEPSRTDRGVDTVSTTNREARITDASRLSFPLQLVIAIVVGCVTIVSGQMLLDRGRTETQSQIQSDVRDILTRMEYEAKLKAMSDNAMEERFKSLEAKIEASAMRNAAMAMSTEINRQNAQKR